MNPMRVLRRWYRQFLGAVRAVARIPARLNLVDMAFHAFAFPQHDWAKRIRQSLSDIDSKVTWQQAINPFYWIAWSGQFFVRWLTTRPYRALAPAIPATLATVILLASVWVFASRDTSATQLIYLDTLRSALGTGDIKVASVAAQRLLAIDPENLEHQFQVAMLDDKLGKSDSARAAIFRLAINKDYGPAALWMLDALLYEKDGSQPAAGNTQPAAGNTQPARVKRTSWSDDEKLICHRCATVAMTKLPQERALVAKQLYAGFLADNGASADAFRLYRSLAEFVPSVNLTAAQLASRSGDYNTARQFARSAIRYLEPRLLANPTSVTARLEYAQALVLDEQDEEAYRLLLAGYELSREELLKSAAAEALVFKAERLRRTLGEKESLVKRFQVMTDAVGLAPNSPLVLDSIVQLAIECSESDEGRLPFREKLLRGVTPQAMHFVEGTILLMSDRVAEAQHHLELAAEANDEGSMAGLLNNLAVTLGASDEKHLPKALRFSNEALRQLPDHPYLLETRGQILLRMKRYQDAIHDLEPALRSPELRPVVHASLADAYSALGVEDLAKEHRQLAQRYGAPKAPSP